MCYIKSMKVIYNHAVEFLCFLNSFIDQKLEKEDGERSIPPDPRIAEIIQEVDRDISPFLKNDIDLFFCKMFMTFWILFFLIHQKAINNDEELLTYLQGLSDEEFLKLFLMHLKMENKTVKELTLKDIREGIKANFINPAKSQEKLIKQLFDAPEEWRTRIVQTLADFHQSHYIPYRKELIALGSEKAAEAETLLHQNPAHFLDTLTLGHYRNLLDGDENITVCLSYTCDTGSMISIKKKLILLGITRTSLLTSANRKLQTNILFSALSDNKRVEILRLLGEREWFSNELAKHFGLTAATMSYHLNKMMSAGLISFRIGEKNKIFYSIKKDNLRNLLKCAAADLTGEGDCPQQ